MGSGRGGTVYFGIHFWLLEKAALVLGMWARLATQLVVSLGLEVDSISKMIPTTPPMAHALLPSEAVAGDLYVATRMQRETRCQPAEARP